MKKSELKARFDAVESPEQLLDARDGYVDMFLFPDGDGGWLLVEAEWGIDDPDKVRRLATDEEAERVRCIVSDAAEVAEDYENEDEQWKLDESTRLFAQLDDIGVVVELED